MVGREGHPDSALGGHVVARQCHLVGLAPRHQFRPAIVDGAELGADLVAPADRIERVTGEGNREPRQAVLRGLDLRDLDLDGTPRMLGLSR
ncbi:hypothetical protein GCM10020219_001430 [Nonomuraea dietziae]